MMDKDKLRAMFPRASKDFIEKNPHLDAWNEHVERESSEPKGKLRGAPIPNKTEAEYGLILESQRKRGEITRFDYQGITLRWGGMTYTPDWFVVYEATDFVSATESTKSNQFRCIEVKGAFIREDATVKFKAAKAYWPEFDFQMWQRKNGLWTRLN